MSRPIAALDERHESRQACWLAEMNLTLTQIELLQSTIGKKLTDEQIAAINNTLTKINGLQKTAQVRPEQRQVKRNLNALAKAGDADLIVMFANADTITRAYMFDQLNIIGQLLNPTPEAIRQAAISAVATLPKLSPGRNKSWQIFAAKWAIKHWYDCGGDDCKAWTSEAHSAGGRKHKHYLSPLVEWASMFFPQEPQQFKNIQRPLLGASRIAKLLAVELTPKESARPN